jgi:hypothetical protein
MRVEVERIQDQLRRAITGDAWHGPSVSEVIESFEASDTATRLHAKGHSACELLSHTAVWLEVAVRRINGDRAHLSEAEDWPAAAGSATKDAWDEATARLHAAHESLQDLLDTIEDARLDETVTGQRYSIYHMLHGAIQHSLYHAGQMMLISRTLDAGR